MIIGFRLAGSTRRRAAWRVQVLLITVALSIGIASLARGQISQLVWSDPATGLAIGGYDPLSYFVAGHPKKGSEFHEYDWHGASWRFASAANRHAFARDPDVYAPVYGGHGAVAMARGYANVGNPSIWVVYQNALYLFFSRAARRKWLLAPETYIARAERNWPKVITGLSR